MKKTLVRGFLSISFIFLSLSAASADVWFVDNESACTVSCGTDWGTAFNNIQDAVDSASAGDDIWVKSGTYLLSNQININKDVSIYGGFPEDVSEPV